jgi:DNA (cytosine-5)-methyltransferase 1
VKLATLCSGIGAPEVAAKRLGWECLWSSEIEPFSSAVLAHHHPESVNHGDLTKLCGGDLEKPDVIVFGSPCQSFSVAGKRAGLDDPRGDITLECLRIVGELLPEWIVWENVPGVLSIDGGRTFGAVLGILGKLGYGFAYRILDAQFFGVPQRRRRVFVVGHLGGWRSAAAVLFERESLCGHPPPRREKGEDIAGTIKGGSGERGYPDPSDGNGGGLIAQPLRAKANMVHREDMDTLIAHPLRAEGFDASEDGTGRGTPLVLAHGQGNAEVGEDIGTTLSCNHEAPIVFDPNQVTSPGNYSNPKRGDPCHPLVSAAPPMMAFTQNTREEVRDLKDVAGAISSEPGTHQTTYVASGFLPTQGAGAGAGTIGYEKELGPTLRSGCDQYGVHIAPSLTASNDPSRSPQSQEITQQVDAVYLASMSVRRLTPRECCRLQGFPDDYSLIQYKNKPAADGPRYKALGNSMAVPVMEWILRRIGMITCPHHIGEREG